MYHIQSVHETTSDTTRILESIINDTGDTPLAEQERRFENAYQLFMLRCQSLHNTNVELDTEAADELTLILNALITAHQRICAIKKSCI